MTRIIAGRFGGRGIEVPPGRGTRPTSDRVREAVFSQLENETDLEGSRVLDLFAGSGALGLEALSRGAVHVLLVESAKAAVRVINRNIVSLGVDHQVRLRAQSVSTVLAAAPDSPFQVVLLDPPYGVDEFALAAILRSLVDNSWLAPDAVVVLERSVRSAEPVWPAGLARFDHRRYGETAIWWAEAPAEPEPA